MTDSELGAFLRGRRAALSPLDIGRSAGGRRRVPGLRRTEVAERAGISVEYYTELEQGKGRRPSDQVLAALSRTLRLNRDERDYLFGLAGAPIPAAPGPTAHVDAALVDLLDKLTAPAQLYTDLYELIAQNDLATALLGEPAPGHGIEASDLFRWFADPADARRHIPIEDHVDVSSSYVADLRATWGRRPSDARIHSFVDRLRAASPEFGELWKAGGVSVRRTGRHRVIHESVGLVDLDCTALLSEDGTQRLVWYSPRVGGAAAEQLQLLGVVGGTRFAAPADLGG